jgi:hypothetical protein
MLFLIRACGNSLFEQFVYGCVYAADEEAGYRRDSINRFAFGRAALQSARIGFDGLAVAV